MNRTEYRTPTRRWLNIYSLDPMAGNAPGNKIAVDIPYEDLAPGPSGQVFEVIDYDAARRCYYRPVDPNDP
jgi:cell wall assembly regulator SMI1